MKSLKDIMYKLAYREVNEEENRYRVFCERVERVRDFYALNERGRELREFDQDCADYRRGALGDDEFLELLRGHEVRQMNVHLDQI